MDLAENAQTEYEARLLLGKAILEYAEDFYKEFDQWEHRTEQKNAYPLYHEGSDYETTQKKIGDAIECQPGRS